MLFYFGLDVGVVVQSFGLPFHQFTSLDLHRVGIPQAHYKHLACRIRHCPSPGFLMDDQLVPLLKVPNVVAALLGTAASRGPLPLRHLMNNDHSPLLDLLTCIVCKQTMKLERADPDGEGTHLIRYRCRNCNRVETVRLSRRCWDAPPDASA